MKRFYKIVTTRVERGGISILLDGKPVKTPARNLLLLQNQKLADAVMEEWAGQKHKIVPADMPLTQIASTRIDRIPHERDAMTQTIMEYLDTDLICYRTAQQSLAERQAALWDPWIMWFETRFRAKLLTTDTLEALYQPSAAHTAVRAFIAALDDEHFTILQMVTGMAGSIVLAIGFVEGTGAPVLLDSIRVDENYKAELYNEEKYGADPAQEKKDAAFLKDLQAAEKYLHLLKI
jgi:chaperone required for assembly of F1-ATPase